jgi:DNA-directed RNA polymerase subunit RPC12/RpoP
MKCGLFKSYNLKKEESVVADKTLVCKDCGKEFIFTEGEQAFYKEKGFENEPQRCPECRKARKQQYNSNRGYRR